MSRVNSVQECVRQLESAEFDEDHHILESSVGLALTEDPSQHATLHFVAGLLSGFLTGAFFSPFDKALYLSIKFHRPFLSSQNWHKPFHSIGQTVFYRIVSHGIYFPVETLTRSFLHNHLFPDSRHESICNLLGGTLAGALDGVILNPLQAIRYSGWMTHRNFVSEVKALYRHRGFRNFYRGTGATLLRDTMWGAVFSTIRHSTTEAHLFMDDYSDSRGFVLFSFGWNCFAAWIATALTSPMNYVRNIQYATPAELKPDSIVVLFRQLWYGFFAERGLKARWEYTHLRLKIGWGTIRVASGMAVGAQVYSIIVSRLEQTNLF